MGRKKSEKKPDATAANAPLDKEPSAAPPPSLSDILAGGKKDDTPSPNKLKETIAKQQAEGPRLPPLSKKDVKAAKDHAFQEDMEKMVHVLAEAGVKALDGGLERLDETYKPIFDLLEKEDGKRPSFALTEGEKGILELTTAMGMSQFSPEFLAKYGFAMLAIGTVASIGFPRFMLCLRLESVAKQIKASQAGKQENAQRTSMGKNRDNRVHGGGEDDLSEIPTSEPMASGP